MAGLTSFNIDIWISISRQGQFDVLDLISLQRVNKTLCLLLSEDSVSASALWSGAIRHSPYAHHISLALRTSQPEKMINFPRSEYASIVDTQEHFYRQVCKVGHSIKHGISLAHRLWRVQKIFLGGFPASTPSENYNALLVHKTLPESVRHFLAHFSGFYQHQLATETSLFASLDEYEVEISFDAAPAYSLHYQGQAFESVESFIEFVEQSAEEAIEQKSPSRHRVFNWTLHSKALRNQSHAVFREKSNFESLGAQDPKIMLSVVRENPNLSLYALYYCCRSKLYDLVLDIIPPATHVSTYWEVLESALFDLIVDGYEPVKNFLIENKLLSGKALAEILCYLIYRGQATRFEEALALQQDCISSELPLKPVLLTALFHLVEIQDSPFDASGNLISQRKIETVLIRFLQTHRQQLPSQIGESWSDIVFYAMRYGSKLFKTILRFVLGQDLVLSVVGTAISCRSNFDPSTIYTAMETFNIWLRDVLFSMVPHDNFPLDDLMRHFPIIGRQLLTPILGAACRFHGGLCRKILSEYHEYVDLQYKTPTNGLSLLMLSVQAHKPLVKILEMGADVHARDNQGNTVVHHFFHHLIREQSDPLFLLTWGSWPTDLQMLAQHGADLCAVNDKGEPPLMILCNDRAAHSLVKQLHPFVFAQRMFSTLDDSQKELVTKIVNGKSVGGPLPGLIPFPWNIK